jgi:hypothetical protein
MLDYNVIFELNGEKEFCFSNISVNGENEDIYGLEFEIKGDKGIVLHPFSYKTYTLDGAVIQDEAFKNLQFTLDYETNILRENINTIPKKVNVEVFIKKGTQKFDFTILLIGNGKVEIGDFNCVKGGFPDKRTKVYSPYIDWINKLEANSSYEKKVEYLNDKAIKAFEKFSNYLDIDIKYLINLIPKKRCLTENVVDLKYDWNPFEPELLIYKTNLEKFDPNKKFKIAGYDEAKLPSGQTDKYEYFLEPQNWTIEDFFIFIPNYPGPEEKYVKQLFDPENKKVYIDEYMTSVRIENFFNAAHTLSANYKINNCEQSGIVSACIIATIARYFINWPIYGKVDFNYNVNTFFDPDAYELWFAGVGYDILFWYTVGTNLMINKFATVYENLKGAEAWDKANEIIGFDGRVAVQNAILYIAKRSLKCDAYYRTNIWKLYHNTLGEQLMGFVNAGLCIGCPELIHYAILKFNNAYQYLFMADGIFPESTSYMHDTLNAVVALIPLEGYSDPDSYVSTISKSRISNFNIEKDFPLCKEFLNNYAKLKFPDGSELPIHDTWSRTQYAGYTTGSKSIEDINAEKYIKNEEESYLLSEFGHSCFMNGVAEDAVEFHLHFSGKYNHGHHDMLNILLWAYGDELVSDLGYSHIGGYNVTSLSHNTVMVNGKCQNSRFGTHRADLTNYYAIEKQPKFITVNADNGVYNEVSKYRRSDIFVPLSNGETFILDIFEVEGGQTHEWMINGCADYTQKSDTDLNFTNHKENLSLDGKKIIPTYDRPLPFDEDGAESMFYGVFVDAEIAEPDKAWQITLKPAFENGEFCCGAGVRARSNTPKPSLKLHGLSPIGKGTEVIICNAPRNRFEDEVKKHKEFIDNWYINLMKKVIIRSKGEQLDSTFVNIFEPFKYKSFILDSKCIQNDNDGVIVIVDTQKEKIVILYNKNDGRSSLLYDGITARAKLVIVSYCENSKLYLYGGGETIVDGKKFSSEKLEECSILSFINNKNIVIKSKQENILNYKNEYILLKQAGQNIRYLNYNNIKYLGKDEYQIELADNIGFTYDMQNEYIIETHFPFRICKGLVTVGFLNNEEFNLDNY